MSTASGGGIEAPARWSLRLFDGFELSTLTDGERVPVPSKRDRVLLAYLLLSPNHRQPRRKLTALLWGDAGDETSLDNLRVCVWSLRKALGDAKHRIVVSEGDDIVLDGGAFDSDVLTLRRLAQQPAALEAAAQLYTGEFLYGLSIESSEFESWRRSEAARFRDEAIAILVRLMAQLADAGNTDRAIEIGECALKLDPLHEPAIRQLMRLYAGTGKRTAAIQLYRSLSDSLRTTLDAQPEADTRAIFAEIASGGRVAETSHGTLPKLRTKTATHRRILAGGIAAAIAAVGLYEFATIPAAQRSSIAPLAAAPATSSISVAVLPFANLSPEPEQEFFSDGITEEITSTLAKIPRLNVIARTSAFEFIAQAIARALSVPLGLASGETLVSNRGIDPDSYQQFLRAKGRIPRRGYDDIVEAMKLLEPIVTREPDFAPAWAWLALAYQRIPYFSPQWEYMALEDRRRLVDTWQPKVEAAARRAIELDPNLPDGYSALGLSMLSRGRYVEADDLFSKALALDPSHPEALHSYANLLGAVGRTDDALATRRKLLSLDPFVIVYQSGIRDLLWINGDTETVVSTLLVNRSPADLTYLAKIYSAQDRQDEAVDALSAISPKDFPDGMLDTAVRLLRTSARDASYLRYGPLLDRRLNFIYAQLGTPERTLERFENGLAIGFSPPNEMVELWTPIYDSVRKTERFKAYVRDAGLVDYWRAKGWPEFCRPTTGDDFTCP